MTNVEQELGALHQAVSENLNPSPDYARQTLRRTRYRRFLTATVSSVAVIGILVGSFLAVRWEPSSGEDKLPNREPVGEGSAPQAEVAARIDLGPSAMGLVAGSDSVWVTALTEERGCNGRLWRVDSTSHEVTEASKMGLTPDEITSAFGSLWIEGFQCLSDGSQITGVIQRVGPDGNEVIATIPSDYHELFGIAASEDSIWVGANTEDSKGHILRIDPVANAIVADLPVDGSVQSVEYGEGSVWAVVGGEASGVLQIDPTTNKVARRAAPGAWDVAVGGGYVWAPRPHPEGSTSVAAIRINAQTGEETGDPIVLGDTVFLPFFADETGVWFIGGRSGATVSHLSASTLTVDQEVDVGESHALDAFMDQVTGIIWLADQGHAEVIKVETRD